MAHPKRKISKTRRDKRRTHYKAVAPSFGTCPQCSEPKLSHTACKSCGYYNGRRVIEPVEA